MGIPVEESLAPSLRDLLQQRKQLLLEDWFCRLLDQNGQETSCFLKQQQDRFANPVAHAFREAGQAIYRMLLDDTNMDLGPIDYAVKIKAVQEQDALKAIAFITLMKDTVREKLGDVFSETEFADLNCRIDRIASAASEMFLVQKKRIGELSREFSSRTGKVLG